MVRRSALKYLPALCEALPSNIIIGDVAKEILTQALQDDEDSVRLLLPASLSVISGKLNDSERAALIVSIIKSIVKDTSWRVRSSLANELPTIAKPFPVDSVMNDVCPLLLRLLRDPEAETKGAACRAISGILSLLEQQEAYIAEKFLPEIDILTNDPASQVRREVALRLMEVAAAIDRRTANAQIVPFFTRILHDSDNEASVAALTSLLKYVEKVDLAGMTPAMLPTILEIAFETHWRVKVVIIKLIPSFARVLGLDEFTKKLFPIVTTWLSDQIFSVRETMAMQLGSLVQLLGVDWASQTLAPVILQFKGNQNYLIRQVTLMCITHLKGFLPLNVLVGKFLPSVLQMATDRIANVKFMVAKTLLLFWGTNDQKVNQQIQACIKTLCNDPDADVKYFAWGVQLKCQ
jgi:serine/threonine-protein phosphatase 2A regulatory subunit A